MNWMMTLSTFAGELAVGVAGYKMAKFAWLRRHRDAEILTEWLRSSGRFVSQLAPRGLLVDMLMPPDRAEDVLHNLLGRYDYWVEKHGARWARVIFFAQSAGSILTFWTDWAMKRLKLLKMLVSN
jgi:hypothetical protein